MMRVRVLLVDDHAILRNALRGMLERESDIEVVAEAANGAEAVQLAAELTPDVIVMDIRMPLLEGIAATRQIMARRSGTRVLALSTHTERHFVLSMLEAGASGYLVKTARIEEMIRGIRAVAKGDTFLAPELAQMLVESMRGRADGDSSERDLLGRREREVLALVAEGLNSQQIASRLHIATGTVDVHRHNILRKLGLHSTAELTKYAIRHGLTSA